MSVPAAPAVFQVVFCGLVRRSVGQIPYADRNARVKAACELYPALTAMSMIVRSPYTSR
ncbi:hypothetical protein ACFQ0M_09275 [Kitasatospora aburaviensis]